MPLETKRNWHVIATWFLDKSAIHSKTWGIMWYRLEFTHTAALTYQMCHSPLPSPPPFLFSLSPSRCDACVELLGYILRSVYFLVPCYFCSNVSFAPLSPSSSPLFICPGVGVIPAMLSTWNSSGLWRLFAW